jgi:hypothetical protein
MTDKFYMVRNDRDFSIQKSLPSTITHKFIRIVPDTVNYILEEWVLISQYEIYCKVYKIGDK